MCAYLHTVLRSKNLLQNYSIIVVSAAEMFCESWQLQQYQCHKRSVCRRWKKAQLKISLVNSRRTSGYTQACTSHPTEFKQSTSWPRFAWKGRLTGINITRRRRFYCQPYNLHTNDSNKSHIQCTANFSEQYNIDKICAIQMSHKYNSEERMKKAIINVMGKLSPGPQRMCEIVNMQQLPLCCWRLCYVQQNKTGSRLSARITSCDQEREQGRNPGTNSQSVKIRGRHKI